MTRFARAKGSKSSNQKAPEDSTPWEVMKEQIIQSKKESEEANNRKEAEQKRIDNYTNFLKEQKVQKRKATWCDFPEAESNKKPDDINKIQHNEKSHKKKNKKKEKSSNETQIQPPNEFQEETNDTNQTNVSVNQNKKKKKNKIVQDNNLSNREVKVDNNDNSVENDKLNNHSVQVQICDPLEKKKKKKNLQKSENSAVKNHESKELQNNKTDAKVDLGPEDNKNKINGIKTKKKKNKNQKAVRRKEINDRSFQLIVNGKEIELIRFDGFPIMKKDAERLAELKNNMMKKGIPKSEVQRTMKLERRRAEKALARLKREVCYNCRKGGHNLSDCPELKSKIPGVDSAEGVCFKCGSTEHRQFECKVQRDKEFRFATCFICKEAGHIARQCPDNPRGLYPNGGCCKLCGDVTHMKKDCPTMKDKKEESAIKLQTLGATDNLEDINQKTHNNVTEGTMKKPKKIKF